MPSVEREVHFRFAGGIERKVDPKAIPTTKLFTLENGVFTKAISIQKRNGCEDIGQDLDGSATTVTGAIRMAARADNELLEFTPVRCYSRETGAAQWSDAGAVYSAAGTDRPLSTTGTQQTMGDQATNAGVTVAAWEDSRGGIWWSVEDATSGRILRSPTQADPAGISPRCVAAGGNLHVYFAVPALMRIMVVVIDPASPSLAATPTLLVDDLTTANPVYDAAPTQRTGGPAAIAWTQSGTANIRIGYVDESGVLGTPLLGHPSVLTFAASMGPASPIGLSFRDIDGGPGDLFALVYVDTTLHGRINVLSGGSTTTPIILQDFDATYLSTSVQRATVGMAGVMMWAAFEEAAAAPSNRYVVVMAFNTDDSSVAQYTPLRSVGLASHAFTVGDDVFATFVHDTTFFNSYVTFRISSADVDGFIPVGRHMPSEAAGAPPRKHLPSSYVAGSVVQIALPMRTRLVSENNDKFTQTALRTVTMDFASAASHQAVTFGRGLYMAGACPMHYDGRVWSELGFHIGPEVIATVNATGGSLTSTTTYEYVAWYEWTDAQGEVHLGPESAGTLVTMGAADTQVTLTLPTCRITRKSGVRIQVARSLAAKTGDTAKFFRITSLDPTTVGTPNGYVPNDTTVDTATLVDRMSDTTLATFDELYTDGGILSNDPTPLGSAIWRGKDRLFASDPSDGSIVRYSQPLSDGYGVQWPPELFLRIDLQSGNVTAGAARDNRVIVWTERGIHTFAGDGPAQDGTTDAGGFSAVQVIPSDVGCTDPASVVRTPNGDMFKSAKGIYLLGNDFSTSYVGSSVEAFNSQDVRRAVVLPDRTQVLFLTSAGLTLLYDYLFSQWSTFTNYEGFDAAIVGNQLYYVRTDGRMFRETVGQYSDAGMRVRLRFETAWIHMTDQLQGFHSFDNVHLLGTWTSPHQLGIQYQTDYTPGWTDPVWFDATGATSSTGWITGSNANIVGLEPITGSDYGDGQYGDGQYGGTGLGEYEWRLGLYETGESIQFRFEDFQAIGFAGPSFELTELVITGTVLGNVRRPMTAGRSA